MRPSPIPRASILCASFVALAALAMAANGVLAKQPDPNGPGGAPAASPETAKVTGLKRTTEVVKFRSAGDPSSQRGQTGPLPGGELREAVPISAAATTPKTTRSHHGSVVMQQGRAGTVQGDGQGCAKGRLPTGTGNVTTTHSVGSGAAGNLPPGRVNRPDFGSSATDPCSGPGGFRVEGHLGKD